MATENAIITKHKLDFFSAVWERSPLYMRFKVGTITGLWTTTSDAYFIVTISNSCKGNGHLEDVFEWFEYSCTRDKRNLIIVEIMNERFYDHLINKRGFRPLDEGGKNVIKIFNQELFEKLLHYGNDFMMPGTMQCI